MVEERTGPCDGIVMKVGDLQDREKIRCFSRAYAVTKVLEGFGGVYSDKLWPTLWLLLSPVATSTEEPTLQTWVAVGNGISQLVVGNFREAGILP